MENNFPVPITNENDLKIYEDYLKKDTKMQRTQKCTLKSYTPETLTNSVFLPAYLKKHVGKLVKIEALVGDCLVCRVGTLLEIGADFVVIKLQQNCCSMVIEGSSIKFITIIHDNDMQKARMY